MGCLPEHSACKMFRPRNQFVCMFYSKYLREVTSLYSGCWRHRIWCSQLDFVVDAKKVMSSGVALFPLWKAQSTAPPGSNTSDHILRQSRTKHASNLPSFTYFLHQWRRQLFKGRFLYQSLHIRVTQLSKQPDLLDAATCVAAVTPGHDRSFGTETGAVSHVSEPP